MESLVSAAVNIIDNKYMPAFLLMLAAWLVWNCLAKKKIADRFPRFDDVYYKIVFAVLYAALFALICTSVINYSTMKYTHVWFPALWKTIKYVLRMVLFAGCLAGCRRSDAKKTIFVVIFVGLIALTHYLSGSWWMLDSLAVIVIPDHKNYRKVLWIYFIAIAYGVFSVLMLLERHHILGMVQYRDENTMRYSLGFTHPNNISRFIMLLVFLWLLIKKKTRILLELSVIAAAAIFIWIVPNSRSVVMILSVLGAFCIFRFFYERGHERKSPGGNAVSGLASKTWFRSCCMAAYPAVAAVMIAILIILYFDNSGLDALRVLGETMYERFESGLAFLQEYGVSVLGQKIETVSTSEIYWNLAGEGAVPKVLDTMYYRFPINYGVVSFIIVSVIFETGMYKALKRGNAMLAFILVLFSIYFITETSVTTSITSFIFLSAFWREKTDEISI